MEKLGQNVINKAHLIASEAVVEEEVSESVVEVGTESDEAVRFVRVGELPEEMMVVMRMPSMVVMMTIMAMMIMMMMTTAA